MLEIIKTIASSLILIITLFVYGQIIIKKYNFQKDGKLKLVIIISIAAILNIFIYSYSSGTIKTILTCLLYIIFLKIIFNLTMKEATFNGIIYIILAIIPDLLMSYILFFVLDVEKEIIYNNFAGSIMGNICVSTLIIMTTIILKPWLRKLVNYKLSINKKIIFISTITLITVAVFFYNLIKTFEFNNNVYSYLILIITLITILFSLFKEKIENENILQKHDDLLKVMRDYESDVEEQRTILHETKNELKSVRSMLNDKIDSKIIIEYIDSVSGDKISGNMKKYSRFKYLPSNGIRGFFYYKFMEAEKLGVNATAFVAEGIEESFLKDLDVKTFKDLGRILGVYLDNAIEASAISDKKQLGVEIYLQDKDVEIIISNTFNNEIDREKIGKENYSTKGKKHGYGLLLVKRILTTNERFISQKEIINDIYTQKLLIKEKTQ